MGAQNTPEVDLPPSGLAGSMVSNVGKTQERSISKLCFLLRGAFIPTLHEARWHQRLPSSSWWTDVDQVSRLEVRGTSS